MSIRHIAVRKNGQLCFVLATSVQATKPYIVLGRQSAEMLNGTMYEMSGRVRITQEYGLQVFELSETKIM